MYQRYLRTRSFFDKRRNHHTSSEEDDFCPNKLKPLTGASSPLLQLATVSPSSESTQRIRRTWAARGQGRETEKPSSPRAQNTLKPSETFHDDWWKTRGTFVFVRKVHLVAHLVQSNRATSGIAVCRPPCSLGRQKLCTQRSVRLALMCRTRRSRTLGHASGRTQRTRPIGVRSPMRR